MHFPGNRTCNWSEAAPMVQMCVLCVRFSTSLPRRDRKAQPPSGQKVGGFSGGGWAERMLPGGASRKGSALRRSCHGAQCPLPPRAAWQGAGLPCRP